MIESQATDQSVILENLLEQARVLHQAGEKQKAIELLEKIVKEQPKNMSARELLGDIYFAADQYKQARRQYRYIFDHRRHAVEVALKLVEVYMCIPKKLIQAYKVLQRTVQYNPHHLTALLRLANFCRLLIRQAKDSELPQDVEELYAKADALAEGNLDASLELADHYLFTQQFDQARLVALNALALDDQDARVHHLLGLIYLQLNQFELAQLALQKVLELTDANVQIYHDLATLYIKQNKLPEAIAALIEATAYTKESHETAILWHQISILQIKNQHLADALHACQQALALAINDLNLIYTLITIHQQMMDYQAALAVVTTKLLPIVEPNDQRVLHLQATLYILDQQPDLAIPIYQQLLKIEPQNANWFYYLALAYDENQQKEQAKKALKRALRYDRHHGMAKSLLKKVQTAQKEEIDSTKSDQTEAEASNIDSSQTETESINNNRAYFDPLDLDEFLAELALEPVIEKLCQYLEQRYWKNRDPRGLKRKISYRSLVLMQLIMGIKDLNFNALYNKCRSKKHGAQLRRLLDLPEDADQIADYTSYKRHLNKLGRYPLRFLMNHLVRQAATNQYIDLSNILLDSSLISACTDLARFFPDSPTFFSEKEAGWSYPKPWTGRVFGFKLSLATASGGEPIDADIVPANLNDITLGKQAARRLGKLLAPVNIKVEFIIGDSGYCSNPLRNLISEVLGAIPLFHFNPRAAAKKQEQYSYLDDKSEQIKVKRQLRSTIERTFAQLKLHFGLANLRIRGLTQVAQYILSRCIAYLSCVIVAHRVGRPDLKASPNRLLWSF